MAQLPAHSPLGASSTYRFMACPGSVGLSYGLDDPDSDHAATGTAAHLLGETCLTRAAEPWTLVGDAVVSSGIEVTAEMANAVAAYLEALENWHPVASRNQGNCFVERKFHCPRLHKYFFGTSDFVFIDGDVLHVWDYKNGAGIVVEVEDNPQLKYYAIGVLEDLSLWTKVARVVLHIAQPNGFHFDGPIRSWETTPAELEDWLYDKLLPAMDLALVSRDTKSGEHCRFCPARRYACPQIAADVDELEVLMKEFEGRAAAELSTEQVARFLDLFDVAKIAATAASQTAFQRMMAGHKVPGRKLVNARANRDWKPEAEAELKKKFGKKAYTEPELKSPAKIEELPEGKAFTARYAFKPDVGLTIAKGEDTRPAINSETKSMFKDLTKEKK